MPSALSACHAWKQQQKQRRRQTFCDWEGGCGLLKRSVVEQGCSCGSLEPRQGMVCGGQHEVSVSDQASCCDPVRGCLMSCQ